MQPNNMPPVTPPQQPNPVETVPVQEAPIAPQPIQTAQPVTQPVVSQPPVVDESKKIKNAGRSAYLVGLLMTLFGVLGIGVGVAKNVGVGQIILTIAPTLIFVAIMVIAIRLKKSTKQLTDVNTIMALSFLYFVLAVVISFVFRSSPGIGAVLALALGIYLAIARRNIHNK